MDGGVSLFAVTGKKRKRVAVEGGDGVPTRPGAPPATTTNGAKPGEGTAPPPRPRAAAMDAHSATFHSLGVAPWLVKSCAAMGIRHPTPIQAAAIPAILAGADVVGCAQTGSGKTAAFAAPILQRCMEDPWGPFALVLTPSRELALQIADQFVALGSPARVRVATVVGGMDIVAQGLQLAAQPHIIVATPGRLAHHLTLGTAPPDLTRVAFCVLDEADRLLEGPFHPDLYTILTAMGRGGRDGAAPRPPRQTLLFSATVTPEGLVTATEPSPAALAAMEAERQRDAAAGGGTKGKGSGGSGTRVTGTTPAPPRPSIVSLLALRSPQYIDVTPRDVTTAVTVSSLRQHYVFVPDSVKNAYLWHVITLLLSPSRIPHAVGIEEKARGKGKRVGSKAAPPKKTRMDTMAVLMGRGNKAAKHAGSDSDDHGRSDDDSHGRGADRAVSGAKAAAARDGSGGEGMEADEEDAAIAGMHHVARSAIVFTATCLSCQTVTEMLQELGVPCTALHSVMPQGKRASSLAKFKSSLVPVLVATDVASRGLDIPTVDLVINYDLPRVPSDYIHRVGRTARAGRGGHAVSIVTQYDVKLLQTIEERVLHGDRMVALPGVDEDVVLHKLAKVATAIQLAKHRLEETGFDDDLAVHEERKAAATARVKSFLHPDGDGEHAGGSGSMVKGMPPPPPATSSSPANAAAATSKHGGAGGVTVARKAPLKPVAKGGRHGHSGGMAHQGGHDDSDADDGSPAPWDQSDSDD